MALYQEVEPLYRELRNSRGLAISLANQALLFSEGKQSSKEALPLASEAHRLAVEHGYADLAGQVKAILDKVRSRLS